MVPVTEAPDRLTIVDALAHELMEEISHWPDIELSPEDLADLLPPGVPLIDDGRNKPLEPRAPGVFLPRRVAEARSISEPLVQGPR